MNRGFAGSLGILGVAFGLLVACGGESSSFSKRNDDTGGTGGSRGGSSGKGTGGASTGGVTQGGASGSAGTGGLPEPPDGVCEDITACGGDPQGTWTVRDSCFEILVPIFEEPGCENSPGRAAADVTGTLTFDKGTLTSELTESARIVIVIDDPCAQALFGSDAITAADLCPLIDAELSMNPDTPGTCAVANGGCRCDATQPAMTTTSTDTYMIVGNQLVQSDGSIIDFCQQDDELHLHGDAVDVATSSLGGLTLLLDRQQ